MKWKRIADMKEKFLSLMEDHEQDLFLYIQSSVEKAWWDVTRKAIIREYPGRQLTEYFHRHRISFLRKSS